MLTSPFIGKMLKKFYILYMVNRLRDGYEPYCLNSLKKMSVNI